METNRRKTRSGVVPRRQRSGLFRLSLAIPEFWRRLLEKETVWVLLFLAVGTWCLMPASFSYISRVAVGSIATRDYVAPRDLLLLDEETTEELKSRAREEVLPVYDFSPATLADLEAELSRFFALGRELLADSSQEEAPNSQERLKLLTERQSLGALKVTPEQITLLASKGFSSEMEDRLASLVAEVLKRGVAGSKSLLLENRARGITLRNLQTGTEDRQVDLYAYLGYPEEVREHLQAEVRRWTGFSRNDRQLLVDFLITNIPPNLHLNQSETLTRRQKAEEAAGPVFNQVRKGQVIVRKGDEVDAAAARALSEFAGDLRVRSRILTVLGNALLVALIILTIWLGLRKEPSSKSTSRRFGEVLLVAMVSVVAAKVCFVGAQALSDYFATAPFSSLRSYFYAIPFASLALVAVLLYGRNVALLLSVLFSVIVARMVAGDSGLWAFVYPLAGSLAAIFALGQFKQRSAVTRAGLIVGVVNVVTIVLVGAISGGLESGAPQVGFDLLCGVLGGLLVAAAAGFAVPIFESLLSITTDIKLVELANTNLPLLRRLAFEAPGTFQHSLMVANLAQEGCESIAANPVLAYTGGLYHDIGKVFRPEYFIENQRGGQNRHDKLLPSMSALIVVNHIKEGLELARRHHLPQPIHDAIAQHHGTRLMTYFFNRAQAQGKPGGDEISQEKYRYPGPKPQDKVLGVLMLADAVEAASRTLQEATITKLRTMIRTIFDDCQKDGQLDNTDLTFSDLSRVADAFLRTLSTILHKRIDYPGFDFNAEPKAPRSTPREVAKVG